MSNALYQASVPVFAQILTNLEKWLTKAEAYAEAKKFDPNNLVTARLAVDMLPLARQIQIATDHAKGATARLAGIENPVYSDNETTIGELKARIAKTLEFVKSVKAAQFEGAETRDVTMKIGGQSVTWKGPIYLNHFAFPNFYFHVTTAYNILRHNGLDIGKRDFIGNF